MSIGFLDKTDEFDEKNSKEKQMSTLPLFFTHRLNNINSNKQLNNQNNPEIPLLKSSSCIGLSSIDSPNNTKSIPIFSVNSRSQININIDTIKTSTFYPQISSTPSKFPRKDLAISKLNLSQSKGMKIMDIKKFKETFKEISIMKRKTLNQKSNRNKVINPNATTNKSTHSKKNLDGRKIAFKSEKIFKSKSLGREDNVFQRLSSLIPQSGNNGGEENLNIIYQTIPLQNIYRKKENIKMDNSSFASKLNSNCEQIIQNKFNQKKINMNTKQFIQLEENKNSRKNEKISNSDKNEKVDKIDKIIQHLKSSKNENYIKFIKRFESIYLKCFSSNNTILCHLNQFS